MSGPLGSSQWMYSSGGFYPYEIGQSLRLNDDDSAYLSRTPSAGNRKTWTWSGWIKRGNLGAVTLFSADNSAGNFSSNQLAISAGGNLFIDDNRNVSVPYSITTAALLRDTSAWYHIMAVLDTSNATSSDRVRLYINGFRVTVFTSASYPSLNLDGWINSAVAHQIGRNVTPTTGARNYFDGYMAEVNFIDGQALDPTSFGELKSGIWVPKAYTGSYGTNGFYLTFEDGAAIGDDLSGNGNDWTPSGLASTDVMLDSPTNNWAVFSQIANTTFAASSSDPGDGGLLVYQATTAAWGEVVSPFGVTSGKWYWEVRADNIFSGSDIIVGVASGAEFSLLNTTNRYVGQSPSSWGYHSANGYKYNNAAFSVYGATYTNGDIIGVALDADTGSITFYKNSVSQGVAFTSLPDVLHPAVSSVSGVARMNFGQDSSFSGAVTRQGNTDANGLGDFYYAPPAGYLALCTANLPAPAIDPAQDDVPADYFNTVLGTGNNSTQSITGVGFQPDFVWMKIRSATENHIAYDAVRGVQNYLVPNLTIAEAASAQGLTSFDSDGFTLGNINPNYSGSPSFVAWNWLAGNGTSSNTDGSITSTVSVNQKSGFSVVGWATQSGGYTVGHGLSKAPELILQKSRTTAGGPWYSFTTLIDGSLDVLQLDSTAAKIDDTFSVALPTSTTFGGNSAWMYTSGNNIAYCFHSVEGYSKFGSYTGNGSADGPFVYCGFRPAFVMVKQANSTGNWVLKSTSLDPYNLSDAALYANLSAAEDGGVSGRPIDILSNGFKPRSTELNINASGGTYIFMAFAEIPVKYSGTMAR